MRTRTPVTDKDQGNQAEVNGATPAAEPKPTFFERLKQLSEGDWDAHQIYVYRRWPRINKSDAPHYIETVRHPIDEEWLLDHHGSGRYSLRLNDRRRTLESFVCEVHDLNRPPKTQPAEIVDCPENARYWELWPGKPGKATVSGTATAVDSAAATAAVTEMAAIAKQALQKAKETPAEPKSPDAISEATAKLVLEMAAGRDALAAKLATMPQQDKATDPLVLLKTAKDLFAAPDPRIDILLKDREAMREQLAEARKRADNLMDKLFEERTNKPENAFTQTLQEKLMARAIDLLDGGGSRGGGKFAWLAEYLPGILDTLRPVTAGLGILIQRAAMRNGQIPPQPTAPGVLPTPGSQPIPDYVQQGAKPDPNHLSPEQIQMALANFFMTVAPPLKKHLMEGKTGLEFADFLMANGYLDLTGFEQIETMGREGLLETVRQVPGAWAQIQPIEKRFTEFLDEFLSWNPNWATQENNPDEPEWLRKKQ